MEGRSKTGFPANQEKRVQGQVCKPFWDYFWDQFGGKCDFLVKTMMLENRLKKGPFKTKRVVDDVAQGSRTAPPRIKELFE